jgi:2-methylisocitrate lyase-like PEP mutase family enzyme
VQRAWNVLRPQITIARTYTPAYFTALCLASRAVAAVDGAPADTPIATLKSALELASKLVAKFGLDPVSVLMAERAPPAPRRTGFEDVD